MNDAQYKIILEAVDKTSVAFNKVKASIKKVQVAQDTANKRIQKGFKKSEASVEKFRKSLEKNRDTFKRVATAGTVFLAGLTYGVKKAVDVASDFQETNSKFGVVFKDVGDEAEAMAKKLHDSYGLSNLASKELLSSTGDLLTGFGFTGKSALDLSGKVNTLAVDLASFTNAQGGAKAVSDALTKALLGERESLKTYGVAIQEADVKARLLANGQQNLTGEALRQAKAYATLEIALSQTKNAQGDFARTQDSYANKMRKLQSNIEDLQVAIGTAFLPVMTDLVKSIEPVVAQIAKWTEQHPELTKNVILSTASLVALSTAVSLVGLALRPMLALWAVGAVSIARVIKVIKVLRTTFLATSLVLTARMAVIQKVAILTGVTVTSSFLAITAVLGAVAVALGVTINAFSNFSKEVGSSRKAIDLWALSVYEGFWSMALSAREAVGSVIDNIDALKGAMDGSIERARKRVESANAHIQKLASTIDYAGNKAKESGGAYEELMAKAVESAKKMQGAFTGAGDKSSKALSNIVDAVKSIRDEIKGVYNDIGEATKKYLGDNKDAEQNYRSEVVALVAKTEAEIKALKEDRVKALADGNHKEIKDINNAIVAKESLLRSYTNAQLGLEREVAEERKRLAMNEFERLTFDYNKRKLMRQKEYLEGQVLRMQKLLDLKNEDSTIKRLIGEQKMAVIKAELEKGKAFRETLKDSTAQLSSWMSSTTSQYQSFVNTINNMLASIRAPRASMGGFGGFGNLPRFATGGVVGGAIGEPVPILAHGGEEIIPYNRRGRGTGGNITVNINGGIFANEEGARMVGDHIVEALRTQFRF